MKYKLVVASLLLVSNSFGQTNIFPSNGNVGVGTTNPSSILTVRGGTANNVFSLLRNDGYAMLSVNTNSGVTYQDIYKTDGTTVAIRLNSVGDSYFNNGNVGIGTSTPSNKLSVSESSDVNTYLSVQNNSVTTLFGAGGAVVGLVGTVSDHDFALYTKNIERMRVSKSGNIGIGTTYPTEKLSVKGNIRAQEVRVETANWPDYVFAKDYKLPSLEETEKHIREEGHLPGIPSAAKAEENGIELGEMNKKLLQKIEELTLHMIDMQKRINKLERTKVNKKS